jgi:hypothetical protein
VAVTERCVQQGLKEERLRACRQTTHPSSRAFAFAATAILTRPCASGFSNDVQGPG